MFRRPDCGRHGREPRSIRLCIYATPYHSLGEGLWSRGRRYEILTMLRNVHTLTECYAKLSASTTAYAVLQFVPLPIPLPRGGDLIARIARSGCRLQWVCENPSKELGKVHTPPECFARPVDRCICPPAFHCESFSFRFVAETKFLHTFAT